MVYEVSSCFSLRRAWLSDVRAVDCCFCTFKVLILIWEVNREGKNGVYICALKLTLTHCLNIKMGSLKLLDLLLMHYRTKKMNWIKKVQNCHILGIFYTYK